MGTAMGTGADRGARSPGRGCVVAPSIDAVVAASLALAAGTRRRPVLAGLCGGAGARPRTGVSAPSAGLRNLHQQRDLRAAGQEVGDWVTSLTAAITIRGEGARVKLNGSIAATLICTRARPENNSDLSERQPCSAASRRSRSSSSSTPRPTSRSSSCRRSGRSPSNIVNATDNRYTNADLSVSPYIKGRIRRDRHRLRGAQRQHTGRSRASSATSTNRLPNTYPNNLLAYAHLGELPLGWRVEYNRDAYDNGITTASDRPTTDANDPDRPRDPVSYQIDPQLQLSGRRLRGQPIPATIPNGAIYGVGFQWNPNGAHPGRRYWEDRFFGSSYRSVATIAGRTRRSAPAPRAGSPAIRMRSPFPPAPTVTSSSMRRSRRAFRIRRSARRRSSNSSRTGCRRRSAAPVSYLRHADHAAGSRERLVRAARRAQRASRSSLFNSSSEPIGGHRRRAAAGAAVRPDDNTQTGVGVGYSHQLYRA